ncbi:MAG: polysaccharide biosynthesis C-terminal domain-containing protein [Candidatus Goldbacteria bacterium]|nr:polysaccharide biosynthesis C-terminal domain-containing protein [Candidatus Goldiibacteriota bacterium]
MICNEADRKFKFIEEPLKERLKKNSITNILYFILTFPLLFFLTPLILKYVGKEVYGIWVLTGTILIFIELFANMQMSSSVSILVPKFDPQKEEKDINEICNTLIVFYFVISVIVGVLYLFFKNDIISIFFKIDKQNIETTHFILTVSIYFFLINFIITGFAYLMGGFNIFYINNILHIIIGYIRAALMVFVLFTGYGIKGIVIVQMTTTLFESIILAFFTKMVFPPLRIGFKYFSLTKLKIMLGISIKLLFSRIAVQINNNIDKLILGYFLNPVIIAYYQLGSGIAKYITSVPEMLGVSSLLPAASELKTKKQSEKIIILYNRVNKYIFFIALLLCSGFIIFGREFINLWLGKGYDDAYIALTILSIAYTLGVAGLVAMNLLNGMEKINETMTVSIICAIINIILSVILTKFYGLKGAAFGTLISMGLGAILYYILFYKIVQSHLNLIDVLIKPLVCILLAFVCNYFIEKQIGENINWILFFGKIIIFSIIYFLMANFVVRQFDDYDRDIIKNYIPFLKIIK